MERKVVLVCALIFGLTDVFGLYIAQVNNQSTVYEVKEDKTSHTLTITNPQPEKPIIREITYYHIIEKPYEQVNIIKHNNITNKGKIIDNTHDITNADNILTENSNRNTNKNMSSSKHIIDKSNIMVISDHSMMGIDDTIKDSYTGDNAKKLTDSSNINAKRKMINSDKRITDTDNITSDKNKSDDRENLTIKTEDIFENKDNLTNFAFDIKDVAKNANDLLDTSTQNIEEEIEVSITNHDSTSTANNNQVHKKDIPGNEINKIISVNPVIATNNDVIILDEYIQSNKDAIAVEDEKSINETKTYEKEIKIENEMFSKNAENLTYSNYYDINSKNMTNKDVEAFIIIVDDNVSLIDNKDVIIGSDNSNAKKDDNVIDNDNNNIKNDNNMVKHGKMFNELIIFADNDDDNPYDGKEGVIFDDRHFTNGHGFQYYYPDPENQNTSGDLAKNNKEIINPNLKESSNGSEEIEKLEDVTLKEIATVLDGNKENLDTMDMKRRKRDATLKPVNEDNAPEDMLKDVMDKVSKRMKRSIKEDGTYGMRLTGNKGVVWNDFDDDYVSFPIGTNVEDINNANEYALSAKRNDNKENNEINNNDFETDVKQELSIENINVEGSSLIESSEEEYTNEPYNEIAERNPVEINLSDKTYGMSLTAGHGSLWNDLGNNRISYNVGEPQNKLINKRSRDDEIINKKIEAFHNFLKDAPSTGNSKFEELNLSRTSTENFVNQAPSTEKPNTNKPITKKPVAKEPITKNPVAKKPSTIKPFVEKISSKKPLAKEPSTEKPKSVQPTTTTEAPRIERPIIVDPKIEEPISDLNGTYGMSLTGDQGIVITDELINKKIEAFHNFLKDAPTTGNSKYEELNLSRTSTESFVNRAPSTEKPNTNKPITKKPVAKEPITKNPVAKKPSTIKPIVEKISSKKPLTKEPSTEKSKSVQPTTTTEAPRIERPIIVDPKIEEPINDLNKTYGMSFTGDQGIVWNDLNGRRVSYHVGDENEPTSKISKDNEVIKEKSKQNCLNEAPAWDETKIEKPINDPNIEELTTKIPKVEPPTEESIMYDPATETPKTNRPIVIGPNSEEPTKNEPTETPSTERQDEPVKTYGISLTGDYGIVWNDLNGDRLSHQVGKPDSDLEEQRPHETIKNHDLQATPKPIIVDKDKETLEDDLLNEIDAALTEIDNILAEFANETEKSKNVTRNALADQINNMVKEIFDNETAKFKDKVKGWVKEEVARQIEEYFATYGESKSLNNSDNNASDTEIVGKNEEQLEEDILKKRKDCEEKKEKKEPPIKTAANNIYGNSVGNGNVTNIFIFNFNNKTDIDEIEPANNETDGIYVFGNNNEKPVEQEIQEDEREIEETTTEKITINSENVESIVQTIDDSEETTGTNLNPPEKEYSNETDSAGDLDEHESGGQSTIDKLNESISAIPEENEIKDTTTEEFTSPDQNIISDQSTETSKEHTETITEGNEIESIYLIDDNSGSEAIETSNEYTNEMLEGNGITDTSTEKNTSDLVLVEEEPINISINQSGLTDEDLNDIPEELNSIPEEVPTEISGEQNGISEKESNETVEKVQNDISEELNGIPEEEPNYISEELDEISETEPNDIELNDISEELNGIPEDETSELEDKEIEIDVRSGFQE